MDSFPGEGSAADDYESLISTTDAELLKRAWRNEKAEPEILKFELDLVQRARQQIQLMEEMVEDFNRNGVDPLTVSLYQMDLDRTMFLLRSYLRTRLQKIEKYVFHIQKTAELWSRLSRQEQKFSNRCAGDLKHHLEQSVLSKLPDQYRSHLRQSAASEEDDMGYYQVAIAPEDQAKTTFTCPFGTFAFWRMPFGLCNAPATFQRCMFSIFSDMVENYIESQSHSWTPTLCAEARDIWELSSLMMVGKNLLTSKRMIYMLYHTSLIKPLVETGQIDLV